MLEIETYMTNSVKIDKILNPNKLDYFDCDKKNNGFVKKNLERRKSYERVQSKFWWRLCKTVVKYYHHLTGNINGLAHNICKLNTRTAHSSFVPKLFQNFSGYDCLLNFEKKVDMIFEKGIEIKREDIRAKLSENFISVNKGCLEVLDSYISVFWKLVWIIYPQHQHLFHL